MHASCLAQLSVVIPTQRAGLQERCPEEEENKAEVDHRGEDIVHVAAIGQALQVEHEEDVVQRVVLRADPVVEAAAPPLDRVAAEAGDGAAPLEVDEQLFLGYKVELEALQSLGFDFLSNEWLAERCKFGCRAIA